ncbi:MAG: nucleoside/nucleotide kinase family protein [Selenomonadaceae bacterium]|nr:nucleoside/nucleotide kinase family protein [Selenomonadaceae bacterium]
MSKKWLNYELIVNGLIQHVNYNQETVEKLFLPLLSRLTEMYHKSNQRIILFLVAPPATGKSTLTLFLEKLSRENDDLTPVQAVGMDGFHYHADFIKSHSITRNGQKIPMSEVKGCPETFDVDKLKNKLAALRENDVAFPIYDRKIHDVVEDALQVNGKIILFEGNWLLLRDEKWRTLRQFADYTLMIKSDPSILKQRLIQRKMQGGLSLEAATSFYEKSDSYNVQRTLNDSDTADETWLMLDDNDYIIFGNIK